MAETASALRDRMVKDHLASLAVRTLASLAALATLAGCGHGGSVPAAAQPGGTPDTIYVTLHTWELGMPEHARPGPTVFRVTNTGTQPHAFKLERHTVDQNVEAGWDDAFKPGESRTMEVELLPGAYEALCPLAQDAVEGERKVLFVENPPPGRGAGS